MAFAVDPIRGGNSAEERLLSRRLAQQPAAAVDQNPSPVEEATAHSALQAKRMTWEESWQSSLGCRSSECDW